MAYFPLFVELDQVECLVIGGGRVAARKAEVLADAGAKVDVISKEFCDQFATKCDLIQEEVTVTDFSEKGWEKYAIVIAATNDPTLNHAITKWCRDQEMYVNSATSKGDSNFIFPAIVKKEGITVGITSEGKSPAVTRLIRKRVEDCIPEQLEERLEELEQAREVVKSKVEEQSLRKIIFYELTKIGIEQQEELTEAVVLQVISKVMREYEDND